MVCGRTRDSATGAAPIVLKYRAIAQGAAISPSAFAERRPIANYPAVTDAARVPSPHLRKIAADRASSQRARVSAPAICGYVGGNAAVRYQSRRRFTPYATTAAFPNRVSIKAGGTLG